jgi:hypothetical protein
LQRRASVAVHFGPSGTLPRLGASMTRRHPRVYPLAYKTKYFACKALLESPRERNIDFLVRACDVDAPVRRWR